MWGARQKVQNATRNEKEKVKHDPVQDISAGKDHVNHHQHAYHDT